MKKADKIMLTTTVLALSCLAVSSDGKKIYEHISKSEAMSRMEEAQNKGTLMNMEDDTFYIQKDNGLYEYTFDQTDLVRFTSDKSFHSQDWAYDYGIVHGWDDVKVIKQDNGYVVSGNVQYGNLIIKEITS